MHDDIRDRCLLDFDLNKTMTPFYKLGGSIGYLSGDPSQIEQQEHHHTFLVYFLEEDESFRRVLPRSECPSRRKLKSIVIIKSDQSDHLLLTNTKKKS